MVDAHSDYSRLAEVVSGRGLHEHLCVIYDTQQEQFAAAVPYLKAGLERGEKCLYIAGENTAAAVLEALRRGGVDVERYVHASALTVADKNEVYLKTGGFDPDRMIRFWTEAVTEAEANKFSGMRGLMAEMIWALGGRDGAEKIIEYESKLNHFLGDYNIGVVCQYNRAHIPPEVILGVVRTHPVVVYGGLVCKNPYYVPPDEHLKPNQAALEVERLLRNILTWEQVQESLRQTEERWRAVFENSGVGIALTDRHGKFRSSNRAYQEMVGYTDEELRTLSFLDITYEEDREINRALAIELREGKRRQFQVEKRNRRKDGNLIWVRATISAARDTEGKFRFAMGIIEEITERKRAEVALRRSEDRYRDLVEHSRDLICTHDLTGKLLSVNPEPARILGYTPEELLNSKIRDLLAPEVRDKFDEYLTNIRRDGHAQGLMVVQTRSGERRIWEYRNTLRTEGVPEPVVRGMATDITERKRAEEALRRSEQLYSKLVNSLDCIVWEADAKTFQFLFVSPQAERILGYPAEQWLSPGFWVEHLHADDRQWCTDLCTRAAAEGRDHEFEYRMVAADGRTVWLHDVVSVLTGPDGPSRLTGVMIDITRRKLAEVALQESEERSRLVFERSAAGMVISDASGQIIRANRSFSDFVGYSEDELKGRSVVDLTYAEDREATLAFLEETQHGRTPTCDMEKRYVRRDGEMVWGRTSAVSLLPEGRSAYSIAVVQDITERKRAEEALRESEKLYRLLAENVTDVIWTSDLDLRYTYMSPSVMRLRGVAVEEAMAEKIEETLTPSSLKVAKGAFAEELSKESIPQEDPFRSRTLELEQTCKGGSTVWTEVRATFLRDSEGRPVGILGVTRDISARKRAEEALELAAKRFHLVTLATQDAVFDWDLVTHEIWRNENYRRLFGGLEKSLDSENWWADRLHPEDRDRAIIAHDAALGSEASFFSAEYRLRCPDGSYAHIIERAHIVRNPQGRPVRMMGALTDLTERRHAEKALRESEQRYRLLFQRNQAGVSLATADGMVDCNEALALMFGYESREEMLSQEVRNFYFDPAQRRVIAEKLAKGERFSGIEMCCRKKDGTPVWVLFSVSLVLEEGEAPMVQVTVIDITGRKRAEEALVEERHLLRTLMDNLPDHIYFKDRESRFTRINRAHAKMFGLSNPAQAVGKTDFNFFADEHAPKAFADEQEIIRTGQPMLAEEEEETWPDGRVTWVTTTKMPLRDTNGNITGTFGISRDITERKRAEEALESSRDQLRALAARVQTVREEERTRVAREIHDELGRALTAIKIDLSSLVQGLPAEKKQRAGPILKEVDEVIRSVRRISTELRPGILDDLGLVAAIEWATEEFQARTGIRCYVSVPDASIEKTTEHATGLFRIIQETLTNVARHANATQVDVRLANEKGGLILEIHDNGKGLSEERLSVGSSLGILGMRERAVLLGGELTITSALGNGTTVRVRVPQADPPSVEQAK